MINTIRNVDCLGELGMPMIASGSVDMVLNMDCVEGIRQLEDKSVDLIIADPPYYRAINEKWDKQWKTEGEYLDWCKVWFNECVRVLKDTGSMYIYGNFDIITKQKVLIFDKHLIFRQSICLSKGLKAIAGRTSDKLRMFPTASEYCLFYVKQMIFSTPFSNIMKHNMAKLNINQPEISKLELSRNGNTTGWVHNKLSGIQIPTINQWSKICSLFNIENNYDDLMQEYNNARFTFNLPTGFTDVWDFTPDKVRYGHPTQKPKDITERIIRASTKELDVILVPFVGSGSECVAAVNTGRNYIGFELDKGYYDIAVKRIEDAKANIVQSAV